MRGRYYVLLRLQHSDTFQSSISGLTSKGDRFIKLFTLQMKACLVILSRHKVKNNMKANIMCQQVINY